MAKATQLLKMCANGRKFSVVYREDQKYNPYYVYRHTWSLRECGYGYGERKRVEVRYADMKSCMIYLTNAI